MKTDPTDTGGLFVGRRPGTRPIRYRELPADAGERRRTVDQGVAWFVLSTMIAVNLLFWGPFEIGWMWVGSQAEYGTHSAFLGITVAFMGLLATLLIALMLLRQLDHFWILARRAAGHDQRSGSIGTIFAITCAIGTTLFTAWLLLFSGAEFAPIGINL
ncbi:MAG TPA: hypothetical protein VHE14_05730 [Solirubrobacteraceae bacterium]|nr:hypothetical protein [Solirubrobacteraceae bacterium]